jgi:hypothetical protein
MTEDLKDAWGGSPGRSPGTPLPPPESRSNPPLNLWLSPGSPGGDQSTPGTPEISASGTKNKTLEASSHPAESGLNNN